MLVCYLFIFILFYFILFYFVLFILFSHPFPLPPLFPPLLFLSFFLFFLPAIDSLGRGWGWGNGMMFVLGTGNEFPRLKPTLLPLFSSSSSFSPLVSVSCGLTHTVVVGEGGEVVGWGDSRKGQLGKKKVWVCWGEGLF